MEPVVYYEQLNSTALNATVFFLMAWFLLTPIYLLYRWNMDMIKARHKQRLEIIHLRDGETE